MIDHDNDMGRIIYPIIASLAGSITSLGFQPIKSMTRAQIWLAVFTSFSFSYFFGPVAIRAVNSWTDGDVRLQGAMYWLLATGSNTFISLAIKWGARLFGSQQEPPK